MAEKHARSPERAPDPTDLEVEVDPPAEADPPEPDVSAEPPVADAPDEDAARSERQARRMGWVPQDEFRGKPETWKSAEEFVADSLSNNRILLERIDSIGNKLERTEADNRELRTRVDESGQVLRSLNDRFVNADRAGFERGKREAEARMRDAAANADTEAYDAAKADLDAYDRAPPPAAPARGAPAAEPARPTVDAVTQAWINEPRHAWFKDPKLSRAAITLHGEILRDNPGFSQLQGLNALDAEIRELYPTYFENPRRTAPNGPRAPSGDRPNGRGRTGRTYADLPADHKAECDKWVRTIPPRKDGTKYTRDDWLAHYDWDN